MKHLIYFCYYLKITDWGKLKVHRNFVKQVYGISKWHQVLDMFRTTLKLGTAFHEYYYYGFYNKSMEQRSESPIRAKWAYLSNFMRSKTCYQIR